MAVLSNGFDATISAAAGEDAALLAELRAVFIESLERQVDLLSRARCDGNWAVAAQRLKSLGASFNAPTLVALADLALDSAPGDPTVIRKLSQFAGEIPAS
ncbi:Hpt domain-containing protein [Altererythrobacter salegens]|uniref:Hpt domain-containing protein n=2 Tax=Croceibacterium salegens TaxID=1737568 RepID=A0A6I4SWW0_9SPHN|nr:Hpt domain-containing protein [Croceibacterium salegens]MXO59590.1 Hpt domain-containing protein [Croceibacterium salegens]